MTTQTEALKVILGDFLVKEKNFDETVLAIKKALVQPEQEPVAWPCVIETADFEEDTVTLKMQSKDYSVGVGLHWLSTTPPQRKPLTDEQITALLVELCVPKCYEGVTETFTAVVRAIEAAHGIKE